MLPKSATALWVNYGKCCCIYPTPTPPRKWLLNEQEKWTILSKDKSWVKIGGFNFHMEALSRTFCCLMNDHTVCSSLFIQFLLIISQAEQDQYIGILFSINKCPMPLQIERHTGGQGYGGITISLPDASPQKTSHKEDILVTFHGVKHFHFLSQHFMASS